VNTPNLDAGTFGPPRDGAVSARDMIRLLSDHVWTIVGVTLVIVAVAALYVTLVTPVYTAGSLVRIESPDPNELGTGPNGPLVVQASAPSTDAEVAMMQSREVLEPVMKKFGYDLSVKANTFPVLGLIASKFATPGNPSRAWFGLKSYAWGGEEIHIDSLQVPQSFENAKLKLRALDDQHYELLDTDGSVLVAGQVGQLATGQDISMLVTHLVARPDTEFEVVPWNTVNALKRFSKDLKVQEKGGKETGIVQISFDSSNPVVAAGVANAVADGYVANTVENRRRSDSKTLDFINQELPRLRDELKQSEAALSNYQSSSNSLQPTAEAQSYLQGGIELERQIASLQLQRTQLLLHFQPTSAPVQNIDQQLAQLNAAKGSLDSRFNKMPASERKDVDLTRNAKVAESIYVAMVNKAEELTVRRAGTTGDVHVVDVAARPADPVEPNIPLVLGASAGIGLMLGALYVFARSQLLTGVTDPRFVEWSLSIPVLGSVLYSPQQAQLKRAMMHSLQGVDTPYGAATPIPLLPAARAKDGSIVKGAAGALPHTAHYLLARSFPHNASVEALRGVRTAMHFAGASASEQKVVVVTGPTPGTGKSFVAANLAVLEAETTKRVLLIDADMRCGHLAQTFGQPNSGGLAELLMGSITSDQAIREVGVPGLSFISCGAYPSNPSELLMMPRFHALLDVFNKRFDLVIVDTPPLLAVSDASIVANRAGNTVLILRSGMQTEEEIEETVTKLRRAGASLGGAVFNAVPLRRSERRAYGHMTAYSNHNHAAA
jgi:tyrosine-protein kinase Etk/Wzc